MRLACLLLLCAAGACAQTNAPLAQGEAQAPAGIGYPSVEAAFRALKADPHATVVVEGDWMVFTQHADDGATVTWRFTRPGSAAHPSVLRRSVNESRGESDTAILCQSRLPMACAALRD